MLKKFSDLYTTKKGKPRTHLGVERELIRQRKSFFNPSWADDEQKYEHSGHDESDGRDYWKLFKK